MDASAIVVALAAAAAIAGLGWFFFGPRKAHTAQLAGGVQRLEVTVKGGYSPEVIRVRQGVPVELSFDRQESGDCTSRVVFPDFQHSAALPANQELEQLKGRIGRTLSALRPAGVVDFDGRRIDTITEGMMVDPGQWVRCIDVRAGKVIVRPVEKPDLGDLETAVFG